MISFSLQTTIKKELEHVLQKDIRTFHLQPIGGGSINQAFKVTIGDRKSFFVKTNSSIFFPSLFEKEKKGLEMLAKNGIIQTPKIIASGSVNDEQFLLLEWMEENPKNKKFWENFGGQLANLHRITNHQFGLNEDNYIGSFPQINTPSDNWFDFFIEQRLEPQIKKAVDAHLLDSGPMVYFNRLFKELSAIFPNEPPSLLHGDLWSGNFLCNKKNVPVLIDPAVYFGNRHMDLAMTTLFGGFDRVFYDSYHQNFPIQPNHRELWEICNLYPLLVHLNLFGKNYLHEILNVISRY